MMLYIGGMMGLYATPLFALSRDSTRLHAPARYHFVAAGYLFARAIVGLDPAPDRPLLRYRDIVPCTAEHSTLGRLVYA